jgi:hypothetical protein
VRGSVRLRVNVHDDEHCSYTTIVMRIHHLLASYFTSIFVGFADKKIRASRKMKATKSDTAAATI